MKNNNFNILDDQITFKKMLWYHLYMGIPLTLVYIILSRVIVIDFELPGFASLLVVELLILAPIAFTHLYFKGKELNGNFSFQNVIGFRNKLTLWQYLKWSTIGIFGCIICYAPMYPIGLYLKENLFFWLPEWYFDPTYGTDNMVLIANTFLVAILIDGLVGPIAEELFFRGYLLPRMAYLKNGHL